MAFPKFDSKLNLFGRYNYSPSDTTVRNPFGALSSTQSLSMSIHTFTVGLMHLINPAISNKIRANYSNDRVKSKFGLDSFDGAVPVADSTLFPSGFSSANGGFEFDIVGVGEWASGIFATDEQRQINLVDNLSWTKGSHQLKFGVDYRWQSPFTTPLAYSQFAEFTGVTACAVQPYTKKAGYALSAAAAFSDVASYQSTALLTRNFSFYDQDTWKISPRLTVTYGLRWDFNLALKGKNFASQPFAVTEVNDPANMVLAPRGTALYQTRYGNVAPRVGIAYQLRQTGNWLTVLRGGFGIFYDMGYGSLGAASSYFPFSNSKIIPTSACQSGVTCVCFPLSSQEAALPALSTNPPVRNAVVADPHLNVPRTYQWNVALEQSLGSSQSLSFTYIGAAGRELLRTIGLVGT